MTQLLKTAKKHLAQGDYDKTFQTLEAFFQSDEKYKNLSDTLIGYQTQYSKIVEDERSGMLSLDNANVGYTKITNRLIHLISKAENNDLRVEEEPSDSNAPTNKQMIPILIILLVGIVGIFVYPKLAKSNVEKCPDFDSSAEFNILVLPFEKLGNQTSAPHRAIRTRLSEFSEQKKINADVELSAILPNDKKYPSNIREARKIGQECDAQLILWGSYENTNNNNTIINARYNFLNNKKFLTHIQYQLNENHDLDTITSISSIASHGVLTAEVEGELERILLGVVANQLGKHKEAIKYLEDLNAKNPVNKVMIGIALGDSYLKEGHPEKAINSYSKVLKVDSKNLTALTNRATLNHIKGNYKAALMDTEKRIKLRPNDSKAIFTKTILLIDNNNILEAEKQMDKLKDKKIKKERYRVLKNKLQKKKANPEIDLNQVKSKSYFIKKKN